MSKDMKGPGISRRGVIKAGGMTLAGVWAQSRLPSLNAQQTGSGLNTKTVYLPPESSLDPAVHTRAENLFWSDALMEHASFFAMLMPGSELAPMRAQAETFYRSFQNQFDRAKSATIDRSNFAAFNRSTIELIKPFVEFKQRMLELHNSGKVRSLVFPTFFAHTAREAVRSANRLERLAAGEVRSTYTEVVDFWAGIMSEHAQFIAHLLDPQEQDLIGQALDSSAVFQGIRQGNRERAVPGGAIVLATEELIDFEVAVEEGIEAGRIKSILHPSLADHIRRESLKFLDELKRSASKT